MDVCVCVVYESICLCVLVSSAQGSVIILFICRGPPLLVVHWHLHHHHWLLLLVIHLSLLNKLSLLLLELLLRELASLPGKSSLLLQPPFLFNIHHRLLLMLLVLELELVGSMGFCKFLVPLHGRDGAD